MIISGTTGSTAIQSSLTFPSANHSAPPVTATLLNPPLYAWTELTTVAIDCCLGSLLFVNTESFLITFESRDSNNNNNVTMSLSWREKCAPQDNRYKTPKYTPGNPQTA
jgi:hypothetical protein